MCIVLVAVVDAEGYQLFLPRMQPLGEFMVVGNADIIYFTDFFFAYIYRTEPMCTFEVEEYTFSFPRCRYFDFTLIPRWPHIFIDAGQAVQVAVGRFITYFIVVCDAWKNNTFLQTMAIADI